MEVLVEKGMVKNIGVSNFGVQLLWDLLSYCKIKPVVNEVEIHPLHSSDGLIQYCLGNGIIPIAYCPIARGVNAKKTKNLFDTDIIKKCCEKYQKKPAQIVLKWSL